MKQSGKKSGKKYAKMREIRDIAIRKINFLRLGILYARQDNKCDFFSIDAATCQNFLKMNIIVNISDLRPCSHCYKNVILEFRPLYFAQK